MCVFVCISTSTVSVYMREIFMYLLGPWVCIYWSCVINRIAYVHLLEGTYVSIRIVFALGIYVDIY